MVLVSSLLVITFIDLDHQIIPDAITIPGIIIGILFSSFLTIDPYNATKELGTLQSIIGMLVGGGSFYLIAHFSRGGMGGGDIKMMAMLGSFLGWKGVFMTTFTASLIGSIVGIFLMVAKGKGRKTKIPFGPFLALGALISLFWGERLLGIYLDGNR